MTDFRPIVTVASRVAWECPWYVVRQDQIQMPDGGRGVYNVVQKGDAVFIVPITPEGEVVMLWNYRHTLGEWVWEIPAGGVKAGQTPLQAAQCELAEETGGTAAEWRLLLSASTMNGLGNEIGHFFLATGVTLGEPHHESTEVMTIHRFSLAEALRMARAGEINDTPSIAALLLAEKEF